MKIDQKIIFFLAAFTLWNGWTPAVFAQSPAQELFSQGQTAASQGNADKAIACFEKAIEADPDFDLPYSALGSIYLDNNGPLDDIVWLFQQAAEISPQNPENYMYMCRAYFQAKEFDWAESACLKALTIEPNLGSAQLSLAWIYLIGKVQPADAVKYFNAVLEKIPDNPKIYYGLGMAYARNHQSAKALDVITTLRSLGEESLASQLERMIRSSGSPAANLEHAALPQRPPVDTGPSQIIAAKPVQQPQNDRAASDQPPGTIRIKLRARLPPQETESSAAQRVADNGDDQSDDDGHSVYDYKPLTVKQMQDRVKRLRGNTRRGKSTANAQFNISGSGTLQANPAGN